MCVTYCSPFGEREETTFLNKFKLSRRRSTYRGDWQFMAGRRELLDENGWKEVQFINCYAVCMGYLSMAIKGLGYLVLTWTTVVLLGGFVSVLHMKDFWSLAFITLVQTAGIFDVALNEKLGYLWNSVVGLFMVVLWGVVGDSKSTTSTYLALIACYILGWILAVFQVLVLAAILCILAIIYIFGIFMSGVVSLWRLIDHDYSDLDGGSPNLTRAMKTLYCLALIQGALFCYKFVLGQCGKNLVKAVATHISHDSELQVIFKYLTKTRRRCEKDPSFVQGMNLITHAIEMISSSSPLDCISGVKILYTAICIVEKDLKEGKEKNRWSENRDIAIGQHMLMKHLVVCASSSTHILNKLLETLNSRGLHDRETRNQAAMIVEHLAFKIKLVDFPQGIQHISSMIETFQQYSIAEPYQQDYLYDEYEQHWDLRARCLPRSPAGNGNEARSELGKAYKELILQGLCILRKLATDENNCRVMDDTRDLVVKIMAPLTSDLLDHDTEDHGPWSDIVEASMKVMIQLISARGEVGAKLCRQISGYKGAVKTLRAILKCQKCNDRLRLSAIWILTRLYIDNENTVLRDYDSKKESNRCDRKHFVRMLLDFFIEKENSIDIREGAGETLSVLCHRGGITDLTNGIQTCGDVVDSLNKVLVDDVNNACKQRTAEILELVCIRYTEDGEYLQNIKKATMEVLLKVLAEKHSCGDEAHSRKEDKQDGSSEVNIVIENQCDNTQGNDEQDKEEMKFRAVMESVRSATLLSSLLSLYRTVYSMPFISDFPRVLDASSFLNKLNDMVVTKGNHPTVENLIVIKIIAKIVISMMKKSDGMVVKRDELKSLIEVLNNAREKMLDLDNSMVFKCASRFETTSSKLNRCTLTSLVKKAKILHAEFPSTSVTEGG